MKYVNQAAFRGKSSLFASAAISALVLTAFAAPAAAQDEASEETPTTVGTNADGSPATSTAIVVTGSRIRRDEFSTAEPITVITSDEVTQAGFASAADTLQSGEVTQGSGQINNFYAGFVTDGGTGANTLGLRNLGPSRTLILLNGHRLAPAGTRGSVGSADLNTLPNALIDRIEILKAGASSIYGSDAIAGVVNIITDNKKEGFTVEAQVNVPEVGAGIARRLSGSVGAQGERFNVIASVDWFKRDALRKNDVDWTRCPVGGYLDGEGSAFGSAQGIGFDGTPCFTLDNGGVTINTLGVPTRSAESRTTGVSGNFNRLVPAPGDGNATTPGYLGVDFYSRDTFDPAQEEEELITGVETVTGFLQAGYESDILGDAEFYVELLGNQRKSSSTLYRQLSLDYLQNSPLVPIEFRTGRFLGPTSTSSGQNIAARAFIGYGNTATKQEVDFSRVAFGVRGDFVLPGWRYDLYGSKSYTDAVYESESFLIDKLANSLNVIDNGNGTFRCATLADASCVAAPALSAAVIGGNLPQNFRDYIVQNVVGTTKFRESIASLNIDGPLFELPGGESQLALGVEYRKSRIDDTTPLDSINGNLFGLTSATATRGSDSVWEAFGEIYLPLLRNVPGAYNLSINASGRYTEYASYGGDWTYKVAGEYEPIRGIGFRASYGTSYRAPALFEQFLGATSGFVGQATDPCNDVTTKTAIVQANCLAEGLPVTFTQNSSVTVFTRGGADTGLAAETSKNLSAGVVLKPVLPESIGSFSLALDYFDIQVDNSVASLSAANILGLCYGDGSFDLSQGFCRFVERNANNQLTVTTGFVNIATDKVRGWDFNLRYSNDIGPGKLTLNAAITKYEEQSNKLFPDDVLRDDVGIVGTPEWVGTFNATYDIDDVVLRYGLEWVGKSDNYTRYATNRDGTVIPDGSNFSEQFYRDNYFLETPDTFYHSASVQFNAEKFQLTAGVRNLFNTSPPEISADVFNLVGNAPLTSLYDYTGRTFFVNTTFDF